MIDIKFYVISAALAQRIGLVGKRYLTQDGRYIIDNADLKRLSLTSEEFINGVQGLQAINKEEAKAMIALGGYTLGGIPNIITTITPSTDEEVVNEEHSGDGEGEQTEGNNNNEKEE